MRKPAGGPQLHVSAAAAQGEHRGRTCGWSRAEGAALAQPAPSLFHVNNKYSHRRPRLVCARRLPILRPRPFTRRGAGSRGRDRARDRQSLRANQPPREAGGGTPRGGSPWISVSPSCPGAGRERGARLVDSPPRYITSAGSYPGTKNVNTDKKKKIPPACPAPSKQERTQRLGGGGKSGGEGRKKWERTEGGIWL